MRARAALRIDDEIRVHLRHVRAADPVSLRPHASISARRDRRGLRNTLPAFGNASGCVAIRLASSALMRARPVAVVDGNRNHAAVKMPASALPSRRITLR